MRVGIVTTWFERGAAYVSRAMCDSLQESGLEVEIYARGEKYAKNDPRWDLGNVWWGKRLWWPGSGKIERNDFELWIRSKSIDVVFFNEQRWWQPVIWCNDIGIPTGTYVDYYREGDVDLFQAYDFLICNTRRHYSVFSWHPGAKYMPWGCDIELYSPKEANSGEVTFIHSAGWDPYRKGTDLVCEAFRRAGDNLAARLIIHAQCHFNNPLSGNPRVEVITATIPPPGIYHLGDFYIYPSRLDGLGLTMAEAMSCGLPLITTAEPPMLEFSELYAGNVAVPVRRRFSRADGYYWRIAEVDVDCLTKTIISIASLPKVEIERMRREVRNIAVTHLDRRRNLSFLSEIVRNANWTRLERDLRVRLEDRDASSFAGWFDSFIGVTPFDQATQCFMRRYRAWKNPNFYGN